MELLVLLALVVLGFCVLIRRRGGHAPPPEAAAAASATVVFQKIGDPALAHRALVENADAFSNRPDAPFLVALANSRGGQRSENLSSVPYGAHWRALRRNITSETLHPSRLGYIALAPLQREAIRDLVTAMGKESHRQVVAVRDHLYAAVFPVVARLCFGDGVDECRVRAMSAAVQGFQLAIGEVKATRATSTLERLVEWRWLRRLFAFDATLHDLFLPLIARARNGGGGGRRSYVDSLVDLRVPCNNGHDNQRDLRDGEMVNLLSEFLGAGTGTVVACLEWTLAHLVNNQEHQKKLRREVDADDREAAIRGMPYLQAVVLESLRMHPPVPFLLRHVEADAADGVLIGSGSGTSDMVVQFLVGNIGRDKKTWKNPDEFRPERFLPGGEAEDIGAMPGPKEIRMMPFGAGHRFCPGMGMAMVNIKCFLAALIREFEWAAPEKKTKVSGGGVDLTELDVFLKIMKKPLFACLTRRT